MEQAAFSLRRERLTIGFGQSRTTLPIRPMREGIELCPWQSDFRQTSIRGQAISRSRLGGRLPIGQASRTTRHLESYPYCLGRTREYPKRRRIVATFD